MKKMGSTEPAAILEDPQCTTCEANTTTTTTKAQPQTQSRVKIFHKKDQWKTYYNACKDTNNLVVIDFTANWCKPCQAMKPVLEELLEKYTDIDVVEIDVDEIPDVAEEYGINSLPTFLLMKKGDEVDKVVGAKKVDLQKKIEKHRKSY